MTPRAQALPCAFALLLVNVIIAARLFTLEYSAYSGSIEHAFIANARLMAEHPFDWNWWPTWAGGMPIEHTYLPLQQWIVAAVTLLTGWPPARSFHAVTAAFYVLGPPAAFAMALALSRKIAPSFLAALAYSCLSLSTFLVHDAAMDVGGLLNLRRLHVLIFYGEAPHTIALALLPLAVLCFHRALTTHAARWTILAGLFTAAIAVTNAFGLIALLISLLCLGLSYRYERWWRIPAIGLVAYCWISPWFSPSLIRAMRANSLTSGGDFRFTAASYVALALLAAGFLALHLLLRRARIAPHMQFFVLFAYIPTSLVMTWELAHVAVIAQPHRYQPEMELALILMVVFAAACILERIRTAAFLIALTALVFQSIHAAHYARSLIRSTDPAQLVEYKIAKWLDANRPGERAFLSGSTGLLYNVFTGNPQFYGGHEPFVPNSFLAIPVYTIYSGRNAGARDAEYSIFWLKAYGARAISVSGPRGGEVYKPFANPRKFEGVLPILWREGDDTIYEVPTRSRSLAHVMPAAAIPTRTPLHGLDIAPVEAYVAALDDPRYPPATFQWKGTSEAVIQATVASGQVIAVQVAYDPGWEAHSNGPRLAIRGDAIGQMAIDPASTGPTTIVLRYTGGGARTFTRALCLAAMLSTAAFLARRRHLASGTIV